MPVDELISRLAHVRQVGEGRYKACCPAHDDGSPSLSIKEEPSGKILLHCFAGCGASAVMDALELSLSDLFAEPLDHHMTGNYRRKSDPTVDDLILEIGKGRRANGKRLTEAHKREEQEAWLRQQRAN